MQQGAMLWPSKVEVNTKFKQPVTLKGVQEFVGVVNFYCRFIPSAPQVMAPIFVALTSKAKKVVWNEEMNKTFEHTETPLAGAVLPTHTGPMCSNLTHCGCLRASIGCCYSTASTWSLAALGIFSKQLHTHEKEYSTFDHELLLSLC